MTKETKQAFDARFAREMRETADGMRKLGIMDEATYEWTLRELDRATLDQPVGAETGSDHERVRKRAS
jgi:hypothetical protein